MTHWTPQAHQFDLHEAGSANRPRPAEAAAYAVAAVEKKRTRRNPPPPS